MEAAFTITERDYVRAMMLFLKMTRKVAILYLAIFLALVVAAFVLPAPLWPIAIAVIIGGIFASVSFRFGIAPFIARRLYRRNKAIQQPFTVQLADEGIRINSEDHRGIVKWEKIYRWRQNDSYVLIYLMPRRFCVVPKDIAESGFDLASLIEALRSKVGNET